MTETGSEDLAGTTALTSASAAVSGLSAAGRAVPLSLLALLPGLVFLAGYDNLAYGLGLLAGCTLAGALTAPRLAHLGAATVPDAIAARFGNVAAFLATVVIVLVVVPVLVAEFAVAGTLAEVWLDVPYAAAIAALFATSAAVLLLAGRTARWISAAAYGAFAASILVPLVLLAAKHGALVPIVDYGSSLPVIAGLEEKLVENGLVDFDTFVAHTTPFVSLTPANFAALILSLALGMAVIPQVMTSLAAARKPAVARLAGAWMSLFVLLVLISVPALAVYAKLEIYGRMAESTKIAEMPAWLEAPSQADLARIHGTSLGLLKQVAESVGPGEVDLAAVAEGLAGHSFAMEERWRALDPAAQDAVIAAARTLAADPATVSAWDLYRTAVAPAAAAAAGNEAATLTQASLVMEPAAVLLALPALSGLSRWATASIAVALLFVGIATTSAFAASLGSLGSSGHAASRLSRRRAIVVLCAVAAAAGVATLRPSDLAAVVVSSLSLAAAGLFPAVAVGLAWKRATAAGVAAAIVFGAGVSLYYDVGIQAYPAAFYRTWPGLSDAGEAAIEEFTLHQQAVTEAEDENARIAASEELDDLARGTSTRSGLANWFGIDSAAGAVFGVPLGLLVLVVVSLLTPRGRSQP